MKSKKQGKAAASPTRQYCPICSRYVKASTRYPNYICLNCQELAVDDNEQKVAYHNTTDDGHGCEGIVIATKEKTSNTCFIKGVKVKVEEAYLGGIVFLPFKAQKPKKKSSKD
ncbi:hypothetical protein [Pedobacter sp. UBA4863]|uniref:hypothetical protein n=1 Tax=Pedobacter sp. UBA4863 TaxID=1947060 RepID=UPI0025FF62FB|nr:hypothetical protein [Pedobacter sp. UBA4863]